jgi:hypothetical protein
VVVVLFDEPPVSPQRLRDTVAEVKDAFLVYDPTAHWKGRPTTLGDWGWRIIGNTDRERVDPLPAISPSPA